LQEKRENPMKLMKPFAFLIFSLFSLTVFSQQSGTMFVHQGQTVLEFSIADVDSIVFVRSLEEETPPIIVITQVDETTTFVNNMVHQPTTVVDGRWLTSLGVVNFATDNTWTISNGTITQIWSDAVTATSCQKTSFNGGTLEAGVWTFHVDCRSNPGFPGDLFSWLAVYELREELCPYPWRVPTMEDFIDLDIAMGGNGRNRGSTPQFVIDNYINRWGGAFGGGCGPTGTLWHQNSWGDYWSLSSRDGNYGVFLFFSTLGAVGPRDWDHKSDGLSLRCVK